jgi:hypothetical protein
MYDETKELKIIRVDTNEWRRNNIWRTNNSR